MHCGCPQLPSAKAGEPGPSHRLLSCCLVPCPPGCIGWHACSVPASLDGPAWDGTHSGLPHGGRRWFCLPQTGCSGACDVSYCLLTACSDFPCCEGYAVCQHLQESVDSSLHMPCQCRLIPSWAHCVVEMDVVEAIRVRGGPAPPRVQLSALGLYFSAAAQLCIYFRLCAGHCPWSPPGPHEAADSPVPGTRASFYLLAAVTVRNMEKRGQLRWEQQRP